VNKYWNLGWLSMALMTVSVAAQTVTGSGTANTVPQFTGTSTVGNSPISVSSSNVGIGTTNPTAELQVGGAGNANYEYVTGTSTQTNGSIVGFDQNDVNGGFGTLGINANAESQYSWSLTRPNPNFSGWAWVGKIANSTYTAQDAMTLEYVNAAGTQSIPLFVTSTGNVGIGTTSPGAALEVDGNVKLTSGSGASITFADGSVQSTAYTGITCSGGDYAESIDVSGDRTKYGPGDVLIIDPENPGRFLKSADPYSTTVTGIYSTKPGTVGRRQTTPKSLDEVPMAMVGIVPTKVSAENGPIRPGDLLVSSSTMGYAMKGTDRSRMLGAVIGKALGPLDSGTGVIEVVVTLQ